MYARRRPARGAGAAVALLVAFVLVLAAPGQAVEVQGEARTLKWEELMPPKSWEPLVELLAAMDKEARSLSDSSPRAMGLFNAYREAIRAAPVVNELDGQKVRLPGFVVPLDFEDTEVSEFLLVPYFGACIHTPPPPSNQIVYVTTAAAYPMDGLFEPVWVTGVLSTQAFLNEVGDAGYTLKATIIEPY